MRAWILDGHPSLISGDWQLLVRERPSLLRALIRRYCRSTSVRARLVATSTPQMLRDIADLFEPALRGFGAGTTTGTVRDADLHAVFEKLFGDVPGAKILAAGKVHRRNTAAVANPPRSPRVGSAVELPANGDGEGTAANTETDLPKTSRPGEHLSANSAQHVHAVAGLLQAGRRLSTGERQALREGIDQGLASSPQALKRTLSVALEDPASIRRLVGLLPESTLTRLLVILQPFAYVRVLQCANRIATATLARVRDDPESSTTFPRLAPDATAKRAGREEATPRQIARWKWQFILEYLLAEGRPFDPARFAAGCVERLRRHSGGKRREALRNRVLQDLASSGGPDDQALVQAMAEALRRPVIARRPAPGGARRASSREPMRAGHAGSSPLEAIFVANAGQVLAAPYLPRLFEMLSLTERGAFRNAGAAERAIHLLQFMVDGRVYAPEHQLMLNKILCGVQLDEPIVRDVGLTDAERAAAESLMQGMIRNWSALGKTSVAGLRETFLQRDGNLRLGDDAWSLLVEPRAFDMLLDRCPWSFAIIRLPWMHQVLHVEWR